LIGLTDEDIDAQVPPRVAADRLPIVSALTNPLTWTLLHVNENQRVSAWAELKRLYHIEYQKDFPRIPPPPPPPQVPLVAPDAPPPPRGPFYFSIP
jgi:hypothetical protein